MLMNGTCTLLCSASWKLCAVTHGVPMAQIALAWVIAQKDWIVPIPGTRRLERLRENLGAATVTFTADELAELDRHLKAIPLQGERYKGDFAKRVAE